MGGTDWTLFEAKCFHRHFGRTKLWDSELPRAKLPSATENLSLAPDQNIAPSRLPQSWARPLDCISWLEFPILRFQVNFSCSRLPSLLSQRTVYWKQNIDRGMQTKWVEMIDQCDSNLKKPLETGQSTFPLSYVLYFHTHIQQHG